MSEDKQPLIPYYFHLSREKLIFIILVSAFIGSALHARFQPQVPGFRYKDGLIFEACYEKKTRVEIAQCLDAAWESAYESGAWDY